MIREPTYKGMASCDKNDGLWHPLEGSWDVVATHTWPYNAAYIQVAYKSSLKEITLPHSWTTPNVFHEMPTVQT